MAQTVESGPDFIEPDAAFICSSCNTDAVSRSNYTGTADPGNNRKLNQFVTHIPLPYEIIGIFKSFPRDPKTLLR